MREASDGETTDDALLGGSVRLRQPHRGHRAGTDAVLLAGLADARAGDHLVDLGAATGAVGLMVAARVALGRTIFVERDHALVALARDNIAANGLADSARAVAVDLFLPASWAEAGLKSGEADLVVTNPPFFGDLTPHSPDPGRRDAHRMDGGDLTGWLWAARRLLRPRGRLCLIHRADALSACLEALMPAFGSYAITPVHPRRDQDASRIVIAAVLGGRSPLRLMPALVLHEADGSHTARSAALHGSGRDVGPTL